jgi:hypothetical protein
MRYHSARVVLGACLIAASSAAQAPASSFLSAAPGDGLRGRHALSDEMFARTPSSDAFAPRPERATGGAYEPQGSQQSEVDYTLYALFRRAHGEFMDRRERFHPALDLRARVIPNGSIKDEPGSFDMFGYDFDLTWKALVSTEAYLTFGGYYLGRRYLTSSAFGSAGNAGGIGDETLYGIGAKLGFGVFLGDNVLFEMETHPGVWSDIDDNLHHEDFDFPSHALFTFRAIDNFFFKVGARYNQVYEDAPWLPLLGFSWEVVDGFRLDVLAPEHFEMSWWPNSSLGILFGAEVTGAEYHVHTAEALNQRDDLRVQEVVSYLGIMSRFNDVASFMARAGIVVAGDYEMTTGAAGFNRAEGALSQSFWAEVSFGVNF